MWVSTQGFLTSQRKHLDRLDNTPTSLHLLSLSLTDKCTHTRLRTCQFQKDTQATFDNNINAVSELEKGTQVTCGLWVNTPTVYRNMGYNGSSGVTVHWSEWFRESDCPLSSNNLMLTRLQKSQPSEHGPHLFCTTPSTPRSCLRCYLFMNVNCSNCRLIIFKIIDSSDSSTWHSGKKKPQNMHMKMNWLSSAQIFITSLHFSTNTVRILNVDLRIHVLSSMRNLFSYYT